MDLTYERPIRSRYVDPYELIWLATARRLGLFVRRDPDVYSMTDGQGLLALATRSDLDHDDALPQQVLHEVCHWVVSGVDSYHQRDWGYELDVPLEDPREFACLRLQFWWSRLHGLGDLMAPTGLYRPYWERLVRPDQPLDDGPVEAQAIALYNAAFERAQGAPWAEPMSRALMATARIREVVAPFLPDYATEIDEDALPSLWEA